MENDEYFLIVMLLVTMAKISLPIESDDGVENDEKFKMLMLFL